MRALWGRVGAIRRHPGGPGSGLPATGRRVRRVDSECPLPGIPDVQQSAISTHGLAICTSGMRSELAVEWQLL
jgi:hypothetical protein